MRKAGSVCLVAAALGISFTANDARAVELQLSAGAAGMATDWRGDGGATTTLKIGVRGWDFIAPYFMARLGYAAVDSRLITMLSVGTQLWGRLGPLRPYVRIGIAHQHEEPLAYVGTNPFSAIVGVGDGIRHRAGIDSAIGFDWTFKQWKKWSAYLALEGTTTWFTGSSGPSWFWGGGVALGFNYGF